MTLVDRLNLRRESISTFENRSPTSMPSDPSHLFVVLADCDRSGIFGLPAGDLCHPPDELLASFCVDPWPEYKIG
jgi:hypothetical protein